MKKRFTRSRRERMIGGVCGGIAEYFDLDPTLIRLGFILLVLIGAGSPFLFYLILWVVMPPEKDENLDSVEEMDQIVEAAEPDADGTAAVEVKPPIDQLEKVG